MEADPETAALFQLISSFLHPIICNTFQKALIIVMGDDHS